MTLGDKLTDTVWQALTLRDHIWHGRDFRGTLAAIRYVPDGAANPPFGDRFDNWGSATEGIIPTGSSALLSVRSSVAQQLSWLELVDPAYLLTYPSIVSALVAAQPRPRLRKLREIRTFGEIVEPELRRTCEQKWHVPVVDMYSTQEVGYIALQCPGYDHYHVQSESLFVEVLNDEGHACGPGEIGRVVLTTLYNYAMPLIRYDIGDFAEIGEQCPCGRTLPVLRRILGRHRNMFVLPDGQKRWPAFEINPVELFHGSVPVRQFQIVQQTLHRVLVRLVADRPLLESETDQLRQKVAEWLGYAFQLDFEYVETIARSPSGKFEDFRSEVVGSASRDIA